MDWSADLELAHAIADAADRVTTRRFGALDLVVERKPDLTPVSDADRGVEREVRRIVAAQRPGDAVLGEEYGSEGSGPRRWIVDPVDGTKNFVRGMPVWATLLALQVDGELVVGVASAPALDRRWWAARDLGAWAGPADPARRAAGTRRCQVSQVGELGDAFLAYSDLGEWAEHGTLSRFLDLTGKVWRTRGLGDFWSHVLVAEGAVDCSAEPSLALWDIAALQVIVEEAGGRFTDLAGHRACDGTGGLVCSNGLLHEELLDALTR
jgi:histidinol-phosphatase